MKKIATISALIICMNIHLYAQLDPLSNQYFFNQAISNPAYTGIHDVTSFNLISRKQWVGFEGSPFTSILNVHTSIANNKVGLGALFIHDSYGINANNEFHLAYSYKIDLGNSILSFGLQTGISNVSSDYNKLNLEFTDPNFPTIRESFTKPNFGSGIFYMSEKMFLGFSVPKFLNIDIDNGTVNTSRYKRHFYVSGGYVFDQIFSVKVKPTFLYRLVDGTVSSMDINLNVLLNERIWVGTTVRNFGDAYGINSVLELNDSFRLGFSAEISSGSLTSSNFGTYEVMIAFDTGLLSYQAIGNRYF